MTDERSSANQEPPPRGQSSGARILVVNHDPSFTELVREMVRDLAHSVTSLDPSGAIFEEIVGIQPDLLVIDLYFQEMTRWQLLSRLHEAPETLHIPVLMVSTNADLLRQAESRRDRFAGDRYLEMPFEVDAFLGHVRSLLVEDRTNRYHAATTSTDAVADGSARARDRDRRAPAAQEANREK